MAISDWSVLVRRPHSVALFALALLTLTPSSAPAQSPTVLSDTDRYPSITLSPDQRGADFSEDFHRGVRSDHAVQPGSGFFYYEGHREGERGNFGFGVATAAETLSDYSGVSAQSLGVNMYGYIFHAGTSQIPVDSRIETSPTIGIAVDYRGTNPIVHVLASNQYIASLTLTQVTTPLYIDVYGKAILPGIQQTINPGHDPIDHPFAFDAATILGAAAIDGADVLIPAWSFDDLDANRPPTVEITPPVGGYAVDDTIDLTAMASDFEDGDLSDSIEWGVTPGGATGVGASWSTSFTEPGLHTFTATVTDLDGATAEATIFVDVAADPGSIDTDGDGLSDGEEALLGTDPALVDTDGDGLGDGEEVNTFGTDPTLADTDGDGLPDGYEVAQGLDPIVDDAGNDPDGDGYDTLAEYQAGTDPFDPTSYPGAPQITRLSATDKHPSITLSGDLLGADFSDATHRGVRSDRAVEPGSGFFYYEGHREGERANFGFGVATAAETLGDYAGVSAQSLGVNTYGYIFYQGASQIPVDTRIETSPTIGIAVDYRGTNPIVHVIASNQYIASLTMSQVTTPLYIDVYGVAILPGIQQTINPGDDPVSRPLAFDAATILATAGIAGAAELIPAWTLGDLGGNRAPTIAIADPGADLVIDEERAFTATASDLEDGDLTAQIAWSVDVSSATGTGGTFLYTPTTLGQHTITATVTDSEGVIAVESVLVNVLTEPVIDTDGDGLSDGEEALLGTDPTLADTDGDGLGDYEEVNTFGTDPTLADTDGDGLPDGYEVAQGLDPIVDDAGNDPDGDGYDTLAEYQAGTDPFDPTSYPGAPQITRLSATDKHPSITLSGDLLGADFSDATHRGVRSDRAVEPGSGFFYYEGHREGERANFGFGVATAAETLGDYAGVSAQSLGVNTYGYIFYQGASQIPVDTRIETSPTIGIAVDYRGTNPIVHVIASNQYIASLTMSQVTTPLYIDVYGVAILPGIQQTINPGDDPVSRPFAFDAATILATAGIAGAAELIPAWTLGDLGGNRAPTIAIADPGADLVIDEERAFTATASDLEDGDLTAQIAWSVDVSSATGTGGTFLYTPTTLGQHTITATVTDSEGVIAVESVLVNVLTEPVIDTDGDGLSDGEEALLGTDPTLADTDGDGLGDYEEVNTFGTDPTLADTDGDGLPDGYEVAQGLDPIVDDAGNDPDGDGYDTLAEYQAGTDPFDPTSYPGAPQITRLSATDKHPSITLSGDLLGADFSDATHRGVRSDRAVEPGSGFFYYEGHREGERANFGFGVATAAETLADYAGVSAQSLGVNTYGYIFYQGASQIPVDTRIETSPTIGIAVDYRGTNPIVHVIASNQYIASLTMSQVTTPLYIDVYGVAILPGIQQTINPGDDPVSRPLAFDAATILATAGIAGAAELIPAWTLGDLGGNRAPTIAIADPGADLVIDEERAFTATASDLEDGDLTAQIAWSVDVSSATGTGGTFLYTPTTLGQHTITATVTDSEGVIAVESVLVNVLTEPVIDTDGDGLSDGEEALLGTDPTLADTDGDGLGDYEEVNTFGTDPTLADTDGDGLPDGYEVAQGLDPIVDDAGNDPDGDGYDTLAEYQAGTDPFDPTSYPGAPQITRLSATDKHPSITLSGDLLGADFSDATHRGVRSDRAVEPGSGFFYYEGHREGERANFGFGVATAAETLGDYAGVSAQSLGVNTYGYIFYQGASQIPVDTRIETSPTIGIAVDYRGTNPIVHVIASNQYIASLTMSQVTTPLYIDVYGVAILPGIQQTINPGDDPVSRPFAFDAATILATAGIAGAAELIPAWTLGDLNGNHPPSVVIANPGAGYAVGETIVLSATAVDDEDGDLTASIEWYVDISSATGTGGVFEYTPTVPGDHLVVASVTDSNGVNTLAGVLLSVLQDPALVDSDLDGLSNQDEGVLGTDPFDPDSDADGVFDGEEVLVYGTDPLSADTDGDGMPDGFEITYSLQPTVDDAAGDLDGDGFTNLAEYQAGTNPNLATSYPGGPQPVRLSAFDHHATVSASADGLGAIFSDVVPRGIRSDVALAPGSGWFYYEGRRTIGIGDFGFGVASALAPLDQAGGATDQSVGVDADGNVYYDGAVVDSFPNPGFIDHYGLAVDYTGSNPVVYVLTHDGGYVPSVLAPITLTAVTGDLHILVYGVAETAGVQQVINGGDDTAVPFEYPAAYHVFGAGYLGAEFMGDGWGPLHAYTGRPAAPQVTSVELEIDDTTGGGISLTPDGLGAYFADPTHKMAVRANQGMIGEFRYWESHREIGELNIGQGMITAFGLIDPYPFDPEQPSMSINSLAGVWKNLNYLHNYDTSQSTYGFAVDYRGPRPIVYSIVGGELIDTMTLEDVFTPIYPMVYANSQGGMQHHTVNFGATAFEQDVFAALGRAGVDTSELVLGWGAVNADTDGDGLRDLDETAAGTDPQDPDTDGDGVLDGHEVHRHGTDPLLADTDGDLLPDGHEIAYRSDPLVADAGVDEDGDGYDRLAEFNAGSHPGASESTPLDLATSGLSAVDHYPTVAISPDGVGATFNEGAYRGARSELGIVPGSGVYYYEGHREGDIGLFGFGIASAAGNLGDYWGADDQSLGLRTQGYVFYDAQSQAGYSEDIFYARDFGYVVDYRGLHPWVHLVADQQVVVSIEMTAVTGAVYIGVDGTSGPAEREQTINTGNDLLHRPFVNDAGQALIDAGFADAAAVLTEGWYGAP